MSEEHEWIKPPLVQWEYCKKCAVVRHPADKNGPCKGEKPRCACVSVDAYCCWSLRYAGHSCQSVAEIEEDGGPCECCCHEQYDDDVHPM